MNNNTIHHFTQHIPISDEQSLANAGVRVTAVRLLVWRTVRHEFLGTFSLSDVVKSLPTIDRSTVFRTLTTLAEAHLLHEVEDGSGSLKYCVCHLDDTRKCRGHVHVTCRKCRKTICLPDVEVPMVVLPKGFKAEEGSYLVKGLCPECAAREELLF